MTTWVDGAIVADDDATVSAWDLGMRAGMGVFETVRVTGGRLPSTWDRHLARARAGGADLGIDVPTDEVLTAAADAALAADGGHDAVLRLTITAGATDPTSPFPGRVRGDATVVVTLQPLPDDLDRPATAITVAGGRSLADVKATSYADALVAARRATAVGADEAVLVRDGLVLEGATSNVAAVVDGVVLSPAGPGRLDGVTMAGVLVRAAELGIPVSRRPLPAGVLAAADEAFLTSAVRGVRPLVQLDHRPVGSGRPGAVTTRLA